MKDSDTAIPVIYYHSVADHHGPNRWSFLSCPIAIFERQMRFLSRKGYYTCTWVELEDHLRGERRLPKKTVHLHFDDGFLDNWTVVHPIMMKLNLKYSVLLTPEFIQDGPVRAFTPETHTRPMEDWWGYLSKDEILEMNGSGLVDFQAHGYSHTWYPSSSDLLEVCKGHEFYPHILWNTFVSEKPNWLNRESYSAPRGYPIFKFSKSLANESRYLPNKEFIEECLECAESIQEDAELERVVRENWSKRMLTGTLGRTETTSEYRDRMTTELRGAKLFLERLLNKEVNYLVFPGGGTTKEVDLLAREFGYRLISKGSELNSFGSNRCQISRLSGFHNFKTLNLELNLILFRLQLKRGQGNLLTEWIAQIFKKTA